MSDVVVGYLLDAQFPETVPRDEFVEAVRRDDGHGGNIDVNVRESEGVNGFSQQVLGEGQSAGFPSQGSRSDPREAKGAVPEIPVERGKLRNHSFKIAHCCLRRRHSRRGAPHHRKGTVAAAAALHPAAVVAGFGHSADGNRVGRIAHGQLLTMRQFRNREVSRGHLEVELSQHLVLLPEVVHVALDLLEIAAGHATRIGQEVRNQQDAAFLDLNIGLRGCRTVGTLYDYPHAGAYFANVIAGNLVFHRRRNQDLDILLKPRLAGQQFVAQVLRFLLVDPPETVGDRQKLTEIDSVHLAIRVSALVLLVPTGDGDYPASQPLVKFDRVLGHIAKSLYAGRGVLRVNTQFLKSFSQSKHDAVTRRLGPAERPAHADGLASDEAGITATMDLFELVEYPEHVLGPGHDIRRRHIGKRTDVLCHLTHPATANLLLLTQTEVVRIANDSPLCSSQGNIHHRALPRHPHRQRPDRVNRLLRMETDTTLPRPTRVVVLHAETAENFHRAVVHSHRDGKMELPQRVAQEVPGGRIQAEVFGYLVELLLCDLK